MKFEFLLLNNTEHRTPNTEQITHQTYSLVNTVPVLKRKNFPQSLHSHRCRFRERHFLLLKLQTFSGSFHHQSRIQDRSIKANQA